MPLVKVCGLTNVEDALCALHAGADMLGFVMVAGSARAMQPHQVRAIVEQLPAGVRTVGVFANEGSPELVRSKATEAGVTAVQLHGEESPEFCSELARLYRIKALRCDSNLVPAMVAAYPCEAILLDAARGGSGLRCDWTAAARIAALYPRVFLAGGLDHTNVAEAIAAVQPYAVDAASRLELAPGRKDHEKVRAFVRAAKAAVSSGVTR